MPATSKITKEKAKKASKALKTEAVSLNSSFAILETGGKQYKVAIGDIIKIEKIKDVKKEYKKGDTVLFDKILLIDNGIDSTDIGTPYIKGAKVSGVLVEIGRNPKITVIKYKQKSRYFKKNGHRQPFFKIKIEKIG